MAINLYSNKDQESISKASKLVAQALDLVEKNIRVGVSLNELDSIAEDFILSKNARPAFKGLYGFPKSVCLSLNSVVIHGIPTDYKLKAGDILGVDLGVELNGFYGDGARTIGVESISELDASLISCSKEVLYEAINFIKPGMRFKELSFFIENAIKKRGFVPLRNFCGHGIGRKPHEEPQIPNYLEGSNPKHGEKIKNGHVFCIEPMICQKDGEPVELEDGWSIVSRDGLNTSHYEHTIAVNGGRARILTQS